MAILINDLAEKLGIIVLVWGDDKPIKLGRFNYTTTADSLWRWACDGASGLPVKIEIYLDNSTHWNTQTPDVDLTKWRMTVGVDTLHELIKIRLDKLQMEYAEFAVTIGITVDEAKRFALARMPPHELLVRACDVLSIEYVDAVGLVFKQFQDARSDSGA